MKKLHSSFNTYFRNKEKSFPDNPLQNREFICCFLYFGRRRTKELSIAGMDSAKQHLNRDFLIIKKEGGKNKGEDRPPLKDDRYRTFTSTKPFITFKENLIR